MANRPGEGVWLEAIALLWLDARRQQGGLACCFIDHKGIVKIEEDRRRRHLLLLQSVPKTQQSLTRAPTLQRGDVERAHAPAALVAAGRSHELVHAWPRVGQLDDVLEQRALAWTH
jgi:hypothetical protein